MNGLSKKYIVDTIYIGGGTPGYLPDVLIQKLVHTIRKGISLSKSAEISIEINPENGSLEKFDRYASCGINRMSIGFQSLNDDILGRIGRIHSSEEALRTYQMAREAGFSNISLDMIIGLPGQGEDSFCREIEKLAALRPEHISLYLLELHERTPLAHLLREGKIAVPGEEVMIRCYESAKKIFEKEGYYHYEISNFSLPSKEAKHNMKYWNDQYYLGFGSSAHSYLEGRRFANIDDLHVYIERTMKGKCARAYEEPFRLERRVSEAIFTGLRLMRGIDQIAFKRRYGIDVLERYGSEISQHVKNGLLEQEGEKLRLTKKGIILSNEVFSSFV